jgi:hypothetical protein
VRRATALLVSIRTSAVLMLLVALMLLASVAVPQRTLLGDAAVDAIARRSAVHGFVIDTLGLGAIATSPLFIAALAIFHLNLVAVMVHRLPAMLKKMRLRPPAPEALEKWLASPRAIRATSRNRVAAASVVATLRGFGFRPHRVTASSMYAVKHRHAAIGFLLFHVSFLFLCAGGALIWYTRWVGEMRVVEGQTSGATSARVLRGRPIGGVPDVTFTLDKMEPAFDRGEAVDLRATVRYPDSPPADAWVNHPVKRGPVSLLVTDIGIAPVLWLQDRRGFGIDRVAVPVERRVAADVPLAGGIVQVRIVPDPREFPPRALLQGLPFAVEIREGGREVFRGTLRPGEAATLPGGRVVLSEVRYWGGMKIVSERGGALLITGFVLATIGATWRLLLHRRDVVIAWSDGEDAVAGEPEVAFRLAGHGEWFADRDRRELEQLAAAILLAAESTRTSSRTSRSIQEAEVKA